MRLPLRSAALLATGLAVLLSAACGASGDSPATAPSDSGGKLQAVASTNVWGNVVAMIGGDQVEVTSLINDPSADPHAFEASTRTKLAVSEADLIVENGGGYDDFMDTLRSSSRPGAAVINAVEISGKQASAGEALNEHVWYDFPTVGKVADRVESALRNADPHNADAFAANNQKLQRSLQDLIAQEMAVKATSQGAGVAITEPVPGYLLESVGADNKTPEAFSRAVEEGTGVPPSVLQQTLDLFSNHTVKALVYNEQTTGAQTEQVLAAAKQSGVAVAAVTETLPEGKDYLAWMKENLDAVAKAMSA